MPDRWPSWWYREGVGPDDFAHDAPDPGPAPPRRGFDPEFELETDEPTVDCGWDRQAEDRAVRGLHAVRGLLRQRLDAVDRQIGRLLS